MTAPDTWTVALETIASIPFTFGYIPANSAAYCSLRIEGGSLTVGPALRIDMDVLEWHCRKDRTYGISHLLDKISRACSWGGLVVIWCDVESLEQAIGMLTATRELHRDNWPFRHHFGYYLVTHEQIVGMSPCGGMYDIKERLELQFTNVAMREGPRELARDESGLRFERIIWGDFAAEVAAARKLAAARIWNEQDFRELTDLVTQLFVGGTHGSYNQAAVPVSHPADWLDSTQLGHLGEAFTKTEFRDGFLAWVLAGAPDVDDLTQVPVRRWMSEAEHYPPSDEVSEALQVLEGIARNQPFGEAAPLIGSAAYLAWFKGCGSLPRILTEQALEEDPNYALSLLVSDALKDAVPPPWVSHREDVA